jgi:hypothetical protein
MFMKKIYLKPSIEMVLMEEHVMEYFSLKADGTLPDGTPIVSGDDIGEGEEIVGGAKSLNVWDDWSAEGEEEE